jgi:hypothetical protein
MVQLIMPQTVPPTGEARGIHATAAFGDLRFSLRRRDLAATM